MNWALKLERDFGQGEAERMEEQMGVPEKKAQGQRLG